MSRTIHCEDAVSWLNRSSVVPEYSFVASMPDISEFPGFSLEEWKKWFTETAELILSRCSDEGVSVFYQSDIKFEGTWVDKAYLCQKAAEKMGHHLLWHKIACRSPAGIATFGRPSYSHILCFSKNLKVDISKSTPDVLPDLGEKTWQRGMGLEACMLIAKFISSETHSKILINPFCGEGSMVAMADAFNLNVIGIERSPKRAGKARTLEFDLHAKSWK